MRGIILALAVVCFGLEGCTSVPKQKAAGPSPDALVFAVPPGHRLYQSVEIGNLYGISKFLFGQVSEGALREELDRVLEASGMQAPSASQARFSLDVEFPHLDSRPFTRRNTDEGLAVYRLVDRRARTTAFYTKVDNHLVPAPKYRSGGWDQNDPIAMVAANKSPRVRATRQSVARFLLALSEEERIPMKKVIPCNNGINIQEERAALTAQGYGWIEDRCPDNRERVRTIDEVRMTAQALTGA